MAGAGAEAGAGAGAGAEAGAEAGTPPVADPSPAGALLGRRFLGVDPATGRARLSFEARPDFANRYGTVQGGFLAAMLDSAVAFTFIRSLPEGVPAVTRRLDVRYLAPAKPGPLVAAAWVESRSETGAGVRAVLTAPDGTEVAEGRAEMRVLPRPGQRTAPAVPGSARDG